MTSPLLRSAASADMFFGLRLVWSGCLNGYRKRALSPQATLWRSWIVTVPDAKTRLAKARRVLRLMKSHAAWLEGFAVCGGPGKQCYFEVAFCCFFVYYVEKAKEDK